IEKLSLISAIERLAEMEILQVGQVGARDWMNCKDHGQTEPDDALSRLHDYHSPSAIGVLLEPATVNPTSFGLSSLRNVKRSVRLKSAPPSSLPSTNTSSLCSPLAKLPT